MKSSVKCSKLPDFSFQFLKQLLDQFEILPGSYSVILSSDVSFPFFQGNQKRLPKVQSQIYESFGLHIYKQHQSKKCFVKCKLLNHQIVGNCIKVIVIPDINEGY